MSWSDFLRGIWGQRETGDRRPALPASQAHSDEYVARLQQRIDELIAELVATQHELAGAKEMLQKASVALVARQLGQPVVCPQCHHVFRKNPQ